MRHRKAGYKLKRDVSARRALLRGLVTSVIEEERDHDDGSEGEGRQAAGREDDHARQAGYAACAPSGAAFLLTPEAVKKLFDKLGPRFGQRNGGYTRIVARLAQGRRRRTGQAGTGRFRTGEARRRTCSRREERLKNLRTGQGEEEA